MSYYTRTYVFNKYVINRWVYINIYNYILICASKYTCMHMFSNETQYMRYNMAPTTKNLGNVHWCSLGGFPVVHLVPRTVYDLGDD